MILTIEKRVLLHQHTMCKSFLLQGENEYFLTKVFFLLHRFKNNIEQYLYLLGFIQINYKIIYRDLSAKLSEA